MALIYRLSGPARRDLNEIWDYLYNETLELTVPDRVLQAIHRQMDAVAENPSIGHRRDDQTDRDLWFSSVHSYLVIYTVHDDHVAILGVVHMARDLPSIITERA